MEQELDLSYNNLMRQKKFLANCSELYKKKPYQNVGMEFTINKYGKLIKRIEDSRRQVNKYGVLFDFCYVFDKLKIKSGCTVKWDSMHEWISHKCLLKWFGATATNPEFRITSYSSALEQRMVKHMVYYDDSGKVLREEEYDEDMFPKNKH